MGGRAERPGEPSSHTPQACSDIVIHPDPITVAGAAPDWSRELTGFPFHPGPERVTGHLPQRVGARISERPGSGKREYQRTQAVVDLVAVGVGIDLALDPGDLPVGIDHEAMALGEPQRPEPERRALGPSRLAPRVGQPRKRQAVFLRDPRDSRHRPG
jgi:hypothetical protein